MKRRYRLRHVVIGNATMTFPICVMNFLRE
jgi:hypothetical protein